MEAIGWEDVKAIKRDDTNSVLVRCDKLDVSLWIDVDVVGGDVRCDWNKYIFFTNDAQDMKEKAIQEDVWNFELFTNEAVEYLQREGVLKQDEKGNWSN